MTRRTVGLIRVLTTYDEDLLNAHGRLIEEYIPGLSVVSVCISEQPEGIHDEETERTALPKIVNAGKMLEAQGHAAVIVSCAADPGVEQLREVLKIPVVGAGSAGAAIAMAQGIPVGVLGIMDDAPPAVRRVLGSHLAGVARLEGVVTTLDLLTPGMLERAEAAARHLVRSGARSIILACTGMSTAGISFSLQSRLCIPVVDPVLAAGLVVLSTFRLRSSNGGDRFDQS